MGGENDKWSGDTKAWLGSSPRGRGKRGEDCLPRARLRLIPARAGKTRRPPSPVRVFQAHPRAGEENLRRCFPFLHLSGSSPRGQGKRERLADRVPHGRLIPARAGKTALSPPMGWNSTAHPRAGGENSTVERLSLSYSGSSPRGRGKRARIVGRSAGVRLIPARAGKTTTSTPSRPTLRAHPRAGGENQRLGCRGRLRRGSSPRGRGKRLSGAQRAGSCLAHPRAGGENAA